MNTESRIRSLERRTTILLVAVILQPVAFMLVAMNRPAESKATPDVIYARELAILNEKGEKAVWFQHAADGSGVVTLFGPKPMQYLVDDNGDSCRVGTGNIGLSKRDGNARISLIAGNTGASLSLNSPFGHSRIKLDTSTTESNLLIGKPSLRKSFNCGAGPVPKSMEQHAQELRLRDSNRPCSIQLSTSTTGESSFGSWQLEDESRWLHAIHQPAESNRR